MAIIKLENMEFTAFHGCLPHEKEFGNTYLVTLSMELDVGDAAKSDNLHDTVNYKSVYDVVKSEMSIASELIEHISERIVTHILKDFPKIIGVSLKLSKLNPPMGGKVEKVTIEIERKK